MKPLTRLHSCSRGDDVGAGAAKRDDPVLHRRQLRDVVAARGFGRLDRHRLERDLGADRQPRERRQVGRNDGRDLGIAAGGLPVREQHDRLAVARHLDRARRDAVGGDVEAAAVLDGAAGEAHPHAVGARPDGVLAVEEGRDLAVREVIGLGAFDRADARPRPNGETFEANLVALARLRHGAAASGRRRRARAPASRRCRRGYRSRRCRAPARCRTRPRPPHRAPSRR